MGPGEDGTSPLHPGAYWVSPIRTNKTQFLMPPSLGRLLCSPQHQNTEVIPVTSLLSHPKSNLLENLIGLIFKIPSHLPASTLPPDRLFFPRSQRDPVKTKSSSVPPLLHTLCGSHLTQGQSRSPSSSPQGLLQLLPLCPNLLPYCPPAPPFWALTALSTFQVHFTPGPLLGKLFLQTSTWLISYLLQVFSQRSPPP